MTYRYMRVIVFFDLPTNTAKERHDYSHFRRFLIKSGFMMLQESVYCKLALNQTVAGSICALLKKNKPPQGLVEILTITEKQFQNIEIISGTYSSHTINSDERLVII